jgi:dynein heavy chain
MINFAITITGLRDQMLSLVISIDKKEIEDERNQLIETNARNTKMLIEKEDQILDSLKNSNPDEILDRDDIINQLASTKAESTNIKEAQIKGKEREEQIMQERLKYMEVAINSSVLFFSVLDLANIN